MPHHRLLWPAALVPAGLSTHVRDLICASCFCPYRGFEFCTTNDYKRLVDTRTFATMERNMLRIDKGAPSLPHGVPRSFKIASHLSAGNRAVKPQKEPSDPPRVLRQTCRDGVGGAQAFSEHPANESSAVKPDFSFHAQISTPALPSPAQPPPRNGLNNQEEPGLLESPTATSGDGAAEQLGSRSCGTRGSTDERPNSKAVRGLSPPLASQIPARPHLPASPALARAASLLPAHLPE